jgi:Fic-DOC domain mobile mystery protein B
MPIEFETPEGATPLEPEELEQLISPHITTMAQLNEAEQLNIAAASLWAHSRRRTNVLTIVFAQLLHKRMFDDVWRWAGDFRQRAANIGGVEAYEIAARLHGLFEDCRYWMDENVYGQDEIAARLHHRLTVVHAFPNGNGRHARLMTDVFLRNIDCAPFSWGRGADLVHQGDVRTMYMEALRAADNHDIRPLMDFARS